jgi:hypothetical protein
MARPSCDRRRCSALRSCPGSCRRRRRSTTCRSMSPRGFTATITSRWPGLSIRCPAR